MVTGGGKTIFAFLCMLAFREKYPSGRFLIIVPTISLLDQWYVSLREDLRIPEQDLACYSGQEKPNKPSLVNLVVLNTARWASAKIAAERETFLIVDECHRAGSPENSRALQGCFRASLGLSATPEREYDEGFEDKVAPILGEVIYRYDYVQASRDGVISPFELVNVRIDLLPDERAKYSKLSKRISIAVKRSELTVSSEVYVKRLLQERAAVAATAAMRIPVAAKLIEKHRGTRSIVFHERVSAADSLASVLERRHHAVTIYHSKVGPMVRRDNLRLFRRGVFDVLVSCRALDEGINVPQISVAVIASSSASQRQRIQRLGRALRPSEGKSLATVYTLYATEHEEQRLLAESKRLEGVASVTWFSGKRYKDG
ncbi:MAG TPA: hypothetical protein DC047_20280 [Blastocatellia bacterium]|nr:hypothetical protein [Blastocatellia bacterium]